MIKQNNSVKNYYNKAYANMYNILSNPDVNINEQTQINIERTLNDLCQDWNISESKNNNERLGINFEQLSRELQDSLLNLSNELKIVIRKYKLSLASKINKSKNTKKTNDVYIYEVYKSISTKNIISIILTHYLRWVSYNDTSEVEYQYLTNISTNLGSNIFNRYLYNLYLSYLKESKSKMSFSVWKDNNTKICDIYNNKYDQHLDNVCGNDIINMLLASSYISIKNIRQNKFLHNVIVVPDDIKKMCKKSNIFIPLKLPMIVKPKDYELITSKGEIKEILGGYLTNDVISTDRIFIPKAAYKTYSKFNNVELYKTFNKMSSIPFKINTEVLEFIIQNGVDYDLLHDSELTSQIKKEYYNSTKNAWSSKYYEKKYKSEMSKQVLEFNILNIANMFKELHQIYFPVRLDQRGRVYCVPNYLNYQSNDLSKSLLLFSKGSYIDRNNTEAIEYFKIYGANCYGNGIDKKSYVNRINWIDDNSEKIYNYNNNDILRKSTNKHLFLAFCIEYKKFVDFIKDYNQSGFLTHLPIQLDATCNGFQHLSLLSNETKLYDVLNLDTSDKLTKPKDFYNYILLRLLDMLQYNLEENNENNSSYDRLYNFVWERSYIKSVIMTIPYNATKYAMENYIRSSLADLDKTYETVDDKKIIWYVKDNNKINNNDIHILVKLIMSIVNVDFENIKKLRDYLKTVAEVHNALKRPISWNLPSGLTIIQSYLKIETVKIKPFSYSKSRLNLNRSNPDIYDKNKQSIALMPNLIHSLDSTTLTLLFRAFSETHKDNYNFYAIHDCFATTIDKMSSLISMLKSVYIKLYSDEPYIREFDKNIIDNILFEFGKDIEWCEKKRTFTYNGNKYKIPTIDWVFSKNTPSFNNPYLVT